MKMNIYSGRISSRMKKIVFLTGTRADYGKIKSLMKVLQNDEEFEVSVFITGMHMMSRYGSTYKEIEKDGFTNIYKYVNQKAEAPMDITLSNTIIGFSNYISEFKPDMIVIHGDRLEALAGAIVGAFNNVRVVHIEGGEVSGTIDESVRHAVTKLSHIHMVCNKEAKSRIIQLGEKEECIYIIGSPDIDIMFSDELPSIDRVKKRYDIGFVEYGILMYHPVTTEIESLREHVKAVVDAIIASNKNYIVVYPNNDLGSAVILNELQRLTGEKYRVFPSIRFEYFLTLLKHAKFMIGNSSAGIRETCVYGIPAVDIGIRQQGRYDEKSMKNVIHVNEDKQEIIDAINKLDSLENIEESPFGQGNSAEMFLQILKADDIWNQEYQKRFVDLEI